MVKRRRVVFSFDDRSLESLSKLVEQGRVPGPLCPRCLNRTTGETKYREVEVTNPETGETRVIVIPAVEGQ